jgi:multidrug efflux pump subunit AcrB
MADNDLDIEGLVDAVRGQLPSQPELPWTVEEVLSMPTPDEIVSIEQQITAPASGLLSGFTSEYFNNNVDLQIYNNSGQSVAIRPDGTIRIRDSYNSYTEYTIDLRDMHQRQQTLEQRIDMLEQTIELLGRALQAQIDQDTMSNAGLSPQEIQEIRYLSRRTTPLT